MIAGNSVSRMTAVILLSFSLALSPVVLADWRADPGDKKQVKAEAAIARVKERFRGAQCTLRTPMASPFCTRLRE